MAVSGVAMSSAVFMAGGGTRSLHALLGRSAYDGRSWTRWIYSGAMSPQSQRAHGLLFAAEAVVFTVGSYQMLFGAVVSPLNARVNFHRHAIDLSGVTVAGGGVRFDAYVDAGPDTGAAFVIAARLVDGAGTVVASWDGAALRGAAIENAWPYAWAAQFRTETIGFSGATGAHAVITLPIPADASLGDSPLSLVLEAIDGATWQQAAQREG
jgi:hypothetical protein